MTADDLQENRRVCKFPCTSRGEAPPSAGSCVGQGQAAGRCPVYSPYKAQKTGRRPPLRSSGGRPAGAPCPGEARAACGRPRLLHIFPQTQQPRLSPAPPSAGSCVGAGASGGSASRLQPVQGAGSRPQAPAAQQRGAPLRGALPGRSPGGLRPALPTHQLSQRGEALPPRAQQQRL